jgi:hypothetical protein
MTEHDDELSRALGRSLDTIPVADPDAALARVTARSRVVRRRRIAVRAGAGVAVVAVVGAVWLGARPPGSTQVDTVDSPSIATAPRPGTEGTRPTTPVTTAGPASTVATSAVAKTPTSAVPSSATATTASVIGGSAPAATAGSVAPPTAAPTTQGPPPSSGPQTYGGVGGQVTVRVDAGNLVLVAVRPSPGYAVTEQKAEPDDVEVRFEGASGRTRVRIRMEDGLLAPEVREEGAG